MPTPASKFAPTVDKLARCYLFLGADSSLMAEAVGSLRNAVMGEDEALDVERLDAEDGVTAALIASASTPGLFSDRRFITLRNALRLKAEEAKRLADALAGLPEYACVAIVGDPAPDADMNLEQRMSTVAKKLSDAVGKIGEVVVCDGPIASNGPEAVTALCGEHGMRISRQGARMIWDLCAGDFSEVRGAVERLMGYAFSDEITEDDIRIVVGERQGANIFKFVDSVAVGNTRDALTELDAILMARAKPEEAAYVTVIPQLTRLYRLLWQARWLIDDGVHQSTWKELSDDPRLPREHSLGAVVKRTAFLTDKFARQARGVSSIKISRSLDAVARADAALKGMGPGISSSEIMGRLVVELCEIRLG